MTTPDVDPRPINDALFEQLIREAASQCGDPETGFFGPDSVLWKIMQFNYPWLIGASRMLLLQSIHMWMAQAGTDYSYGFKFPMKRAVNTYMHMSQIIFGDRETALHTAQQIRSIHNRIQGELQQKEHPFPSNHYQANDANALLWVHATLWETTVLTYEMLYAPLQPAEKEKLHEELKLLGLLFGIPQQQMPTSWDAFLEYNRAMWAAPQLSGTGRSRELATYFLDQLGDTMPAVFAPFFYLLREFTISILPDPIRQKMALHYKPWAAKTLLLAMKVIVRTVWIPTPYNGLMVQRRARLASLKSCKSLADRYWLFMDTTAMAMLRLTTLVFIGRRKVDDGMSTRRMIALINRKIY